MDMVCAGCPFIAGDFCTINQWPECHGERKENENENGNEEESE